MLGNLSEYSWGKANETKNKNYFVEVGFHSSWLPSRIKFFFFAFIIREILAGHY